MSDQQYRLMMTDIEQLRTRVAELERELERFKTMSTVEMMCENTNVDAHVREWEVRCLRAEQQLAARTYTWTTAQPTVEGYYWFREGPNDTDPWILRVTELDMKVIAGGQWAGPIMGPIE